MKKELEIFKTTRELVSTRAKKLTEGSVLSVESEVHAAHVLFDEYRRMGLLEAGDVDLVFRTRMDLGGTLCESDLRKILTGILSARFSNPKFGLSAIHLSQMPAYLPEVVSLLLEIAAYECVREQLTQSVDIFNQRADKMRWAPSGERVSRMIRLSYRRLDPRDVLSSAERAIAGERGKVSWAKREIKKEQLKSQSVSLEPDSAREDLQSSGSNT